MDIAVVRLPKISNFTDFDVFGQYPDVSVRYVSEPAELSGADMVVIPGSKSTIADLGWMRGQGLADEIIRLSGEGLPVFGICGGYQMLGTKVSDPEGAEGGGEAAGLGLLPVSTVLSGDKKTEQFRGRFTDAEGIFSGLSGLEIEGYEIHAGRTCRDDSTGRSVSGFTSGDTGVCCGNIYGTYIHGIFDNGGIAGTVVNALADRKGAALASCDELSRREFREKEYDRLADMLREHLDMDRIYSMLREAAF